MLHIPSLGPSPRRFRSTQVHPITARAALNLLDAGLLPAKSKAPIPALIEQGFRAWLDRHAAGMKHIGIRIDYRDDTQSARIEMGTTLAWPLYVGQRLSALQKQYPGLGETVLWHLDHDLQGNLGIFTPAQTLDAAQWMHWEGNGDESAVAEMLKGEGETYTGVTRAEFDRSLPRWASAPRQRLKPAALRRLAHAKHSLAGKVAAALLELRAIGGEFTPSEDGITYWPPAQVLVWGPGDRVTHRLIDDIGEMHFNAGEYVEHFAEVEIENAEQTSEAFVGFLKSAEKTVHTLRAADHLLQLIGKREPGGRE